MKGPIGRWRAWQDRNEAAAVTALETAHAAWLADLRPVDEVFDWARHETELDTARLEAAELRKARALERLRRQATE